MNWREKVNKELAAKPLRTRATELLTSMVLAGIACTFLSLLAVMMIGGTTAAERIPLHLWLSIVSTASCWAILGVNKWAEGRFEDQIPMRMAMLTAGAGVGLLAAGVSQALLIGVPQMHEWGIDHHDALLMEVTNYDRHYSPAQYGPQSVVPGAMISVMYFACCSSRSVGGGWPSIPVARGSAWSASAWRSAGRGSRI